VSELDELRARVGTLEHLLEVHERVAAQQTRRLEEAKAEALERAEEARRHASILDLVLRSMADGVVVIDPSGRTVLRNPASERFLADEDGPSGEYGVFRGRGAERSSPEDEPLARALRGELVNDEVFVRTARVPEGADVAITANPMLDASGAASGAVAVFRDVTEHKKLLEAVARRNRELEESEQVKSELVERLRYAVDELSNPILEVWDDVLVMPVIGLVDSRRITDMVQRLLAEVTRTQASFVIVDVTGVEIVDTKTADHLIKLMRKVEIVGARCVLTGIRPAVSETLVDIGVDFGRVLTLRNLKHGLREALRHRRNERYASAELDEDDGEMDAEPREGRRATRVHRR
jgi:rsbT co-antagonist protein RsbR